MLASMRNFQQRRHFRVIIRGALVNIYIFKTKYTYIINLDKDWPIYRLL